MPLDLLEHAAAIRKIQGKNIVFGDPDIIKYIHAASKALTNEESAINCSECHGEGEIEAECIECEGSGIVQERCSCQN